MNHTLHLLTARRRRQGSGGLRRQSAEALAQAGLRWGALFLGLLLPSLIPCEAQGIVSPILGAVGAWLPHGRKASHSYLTVVGPPPLQFQEAEVASLKDAVIPRPAPPPALRPLAQSSGPGSILDVLLAPEWPPPLPKLWRSGVSGLRSLGEGGLPASRTPKSGPESQSVPADSPPILPDEGSAGVHSEDFLPFFQFPG